jgi:hypothetical protein
MTASSLNVVVRKIRARRVLRRERTRQQRATQTWRYRRLALPLQRSYTAAKSDQPGRSSSGSLAMLAAMRRASSRVSKRAADRRPVKEHGYPHELWTTRLLARHARQRGPAAGHECLSHLVQGTVCKILGQEDIKPHKVRYYLDRRDAEFEQKMAEVLCVYREVQVLKKAAAKPNKPEKPVAIVSYDEKPGIQAIATSSCLEATRIWRKTERASLEKKPSIKLSQEPCLGVAILVRDGSPPVTTNHPSDVPHPLPRRIAWVRLSTTSPRVRPSPNDRRVGIRIRTFAVGATFDPPGEGLWLF